MSDNFEYGDPRDNEPGTFEPDVADSVDEIESKPVQHDDADQEFSAHAPRTARSATGQSGSATDSAASSKTTSAPMTPQSPVRRPVRRGAPRARRMNLSLTHCDAWSVAKVTFLLGVAGGIIQIVATALIWTLLNVVGVFDQVTQIVSSTGLDTGGFNLSDVLSMSTVLSAVTILSIIEVILVTLLATIGAWLYNVVSALVGGVHVTLGDD